MKEVKTNICCFLFYNWGHPLLCMIKLKQCFVAGGNKDVLGRPGICEP